MAHVTKTIEEDEMLDSTVLIIGGGAAGLCAAIAAARLGADVTILERDARVGKKILASGNGRCNLSNLSISTQAYNQPDFVAPVLGRYSCEAIQSFFGTMGLLTSADDEGRLYPVTNAASSVLDVLRLECEHLGVELRCGFEVTRIAGEEAGVGGFRAFSPEGDTVRAASVVVTTGDGALLAQFGHAHVTTVPVLGPIKTESERIRGLSGVRVRCAATLIAGADSDGGGEAVATERGELLFRDYGVSGIMVFDLSRFLRSQCAISIDFLPDISLPQAQELIEQRCAALPWRTADSFFTGMLHDRVSCALLRTAGIRSDMPAERLPAATLAGLLKDFRLNVTGMGDARQSQVTRGGASVTEFDPETMASRKLAGLFAAGEVLDVDGRSGGFNLHWAWASGIVAGENAARHAISAADMARGSA